MARFRGRIKGSRGEATRLGTSSSGIEAEANGWDLGLKVYAFPDFGGTVDRFTVCVTGGSSNEHERETRRVLVAAEPEGGTGLPVQIIVTVPRLKKGLRLSADGKYQFTIVEE